MRHQVELYAGEFGARPSNKVQQFVPGGTAVLSVRRLVQ